MTVLSGSISPQMGGAIRVPIDTSPAFANTEHESQQSNGKFSAGVGSYALVVEADGYSEDQFAGFSVFGDYAFNDHFSLRGQYYSVEHDDFSELEASGLEANAYFGTGLASNGFKAFIGGGITTRNTSNE